MKVLIDIVHPAHVHLTKHFAHEMESRGHQVLFTCRQKEFVVQLLEAERLQFVSLGKKYDTTMKKIWGLLEFTFKIWRISVRFKPDVYVSHGSMYAAFVAWLRGKPHISFEDTYNMEQIRLYRPFTQVILTGDYPHPLLSAKKEVRMAGYHGLAYLHPNRFKADESVLEELGVAKGEKYVVVRFVAWNATHDWGHTGISEENKRKAVEEFSKQGRVFISSEKELPASLEKYRLPTHPSRIHDVLAYATMVFGESSSMAEEAAMLGVPSIFLDNESRYYTKDIENKYGLIYNLTESEEDQQKAVELGKTIMTTNPSQWKERARTMLEEKIDVTAFVAWFVENYPESRKIVKENPDYQYRFN